MNLFLENQNEDFELSDNSTEFIDLTIQLDHLLERGCALGPTTPDSRTTMREKVVELKRNGVKTERNGTKTERPWSYFITLAFPTREKFKIKHLELSAQRNRIVFSDIRYGECTQNEQYEWLMWILRKHIQLVADEYDIFFEQTKEGNLHIHGRLRTEEKAKNIKMYFHRMFEVPSRCNRFVDIKVYDDSRWTDYDKKKSKDYQTLKYQHFKNI